jgi:thiol:disulfide interchange protein
VPRTGPGSEVVKQVMGLLLLAVAAFFLGVPVAAALQRPPDPASRAYWWVVAGFVVIAAAFAIVRTWRVTENPRWRAAIGALAGLTAVAALVVARGLTRPAPIAWVDYTPDRLSAAAARGDVVVMDFTAEWCLNCKALEAGVLYRPEVVALMEEPGVVPMRIDLTGDNPPGRELMRNLEWVGLPLLAVLGPATGYESTEMKYDSYTADMVRQAVSVARGG